MTTPTLLSKETINGQTFTSHRALFVTPRGSCGVRITYRIDGVIISRTKWAQRLMAAPLTTDNGAA